MLRKFKVSNFKSFDKDFELDLTDTKGYEFNKNCIKDGVVNNALIYGPNGVGKSNLAMAIFDIIQNLTDINKGESAYNNYLNAFNETKFAEFYFEFQIDSNIVVYEYKKSNYKTIVYERFLINNKELVLFDRLNDSNARIQLKGAETLKSIIDNQELSILKYIKNNSDLEDNTENNVFNLFFKFVEKMLYFRSLTDTTYLGTDVGRRNILEDILEKNNLEDFQNFLNTAGIECTLSRVSDFGKETIGFNLNGKILPFGEVASTGTHSLTLFYFWLQSIKDSSKVSFLFIDEFDAFYHHSLSALIIEKLKETNVQFILTTHNTSIISNDILRPDCYFLMNKKQIKSLSKLTDKELREAHNIEKMYKAGSFNV
jgi:AAA15 family ATPase/GTPase